MGSEDPSAPPGDQLGLEARVGLEYHRQDAIRKAWESAAVGKWQMFGYWAAIESHLREIQHRPDSEGGPFREVRLLAQTKVA